MPKVIETLVYQFDELSDKAKEKARDWYREASAGDNYFAESVIEDANEIAGRMGIEIAQRSFQTIGGKTRYEPAVSWSGFSCQGDGASFEGKLVSLESGTALERVKDHAPVDETLHAIAARIDALQAKYSNRLAAKIEISGHHYCHSNMMQVDAVVIDSEGDETEISREDDKELTSALRAFADWIYDQLETEYNYQNSNEQIDETIRANEYEFTARGERF